MSINWATVVLSGLSDNCCCILHAAFPKLVLPGHPRAAAPDELVNRLTKLLLPHAVLPLVQAQQHASFRAIAKFVSGA